MKPWILRPMQKRFGPKTLKSRLAITLFIASAVPIVLVGYISYYWIYSVQMERNSSDIQAQVQNLYQNMENRLDELGRASQLLVIEGGIGKELINYIESGSSLDRFLMYQDIMQSTANVSFANPGLNAMFYYAPTYKEPILFPNVQIKSDVLVESQPSLFVKKLLTYRGPHPSLNEQNSPLVFSLLRKMEYAGDLPIYIYIERDISDLLQNFPDQLILVNEQGEIIYSNLEAFPIGESFNSANKEFHFFGVEGGQAWKLYRAIPSQDYLRAVNTWKMQFLLISFISLMVGVLLAWVIWRMIYSPIRTINREIRKYSYGQGERPTATTGLIEFDQVLGSFQQMKDRNSKLISDIEEKEKRRGQLEVEKLLVQINPHFLHNTLNTIQWIARINGQQDIARLVSVFTRVLHYNLGKKSIIVTVGDEVAAINDYIELQSIRYDHQFRVDIDIDSDILEVPIPRFILQPLVENAIYHGGKDEDGIITVAIHRKGEGIKLSVQDNGDGIPEQRLEQMLNQDDELRKSGLGIGLNYVKKMLDVYYEGMASLNIQSALGEGTCITISLPGQIKEGTVYRD